MLDEIQQKLLLIIGIIAFAIFLIYISSSYQQYYIIVAYLVSPLSKKY